MDDIALNVHHVGCMYLLATIYCMCNYRLSVCIHYSQRYCAACVLVLKFHVFLLPLVAQLAHP